jgi:hypothetical protein
MHALVARARSASPRALAAVAAVLVAMIALAVFASVMSNRDYRRTGTNSAVVPTHVVVLKGQRVCQKGEHAPPGSRFIAPWVGGPAGAEAGPASVTIWNGEQVLARGRSPARFPTGITRFELDRTIDRSVYDTTLCFTNESPVPLNVYGDWAGAGSGATFPELPGNGPLVVRVDWFADEPQSWWQIAGTMAGRFPLLKAEFLDAWSFWASLVVLLAIGAAGALAVIREARP